MKIFFFLFFIIFFFDCQTGGKSVVNSCGNKGYKATKNMPDKAENCKDSDEPYCKLITILEKLDSKEPIKFCGIVHGKYNDKEVLSEVKDLIKVYDIKVEKGNILKSSLILKFLFIVLILL